MSIGELLAVKKALFQQQLLTLKHYYPKSLRFALLDLALGTASLCFNPYRICRKRRLGPYGETPLTTLHRIAQFCQLSSSDCWVELGSGRGKGCFWLSLFIGCRTLGIEAIPLFSRLSRFLAFLFRIPSRFQCANFHETDLSQATHIYLYSTCMSEEELASLSEKIPLQAKVITISSPMPSCTLLGSFSVSFPWGNTEAYLSIKEAV